MTVMQINCVYGKGSTGRITQDIHQYLTQNTIHSVVLYGRGEITREKDVYKVSSELEAKIHSLLSKLFGVDFGHSPFATGRAIQIIKKEHPDVVHLHCLNGHFINIYKLLKYLKINNIKTVLTLHAEIMHTAGCEHAMECDKWKTECHDCSVIKGKISQIYRDDAKHCYRLMKKAFEGFENLTIVGVSEWLTERAKLSPITSAARFETVHNGVDTSIFHNTDASFLRIRLLIPRDRKIILHVTPNFYHPIKGGKYVLELARMMPNYQFIIVGFNGKKSKIPSNVITVGHTADKTELAEYYSMADCFVCTSIRESYPTVCLEAVACNCPVVGFETGGIPEIIRMGNGYTVTPYSLNEMVDKIILSMNQKENEKYTEAELEELCSYKSMCKKYLQIYGKT